MEMGAMRRILKRAKRWHLVGEGLRPLKERRQVGRALSHEEKVLLLKIAESKPEWQNVRLAQILALNTTMRGCEIKGQRWRDVDLIDRTLTAVRATTKTDAGERIIPLNANAAGGYRGAVSPCSHVWRLRGGLLRISRVRKRKN
jgi:integrase